MYWQAGRRAGWDPFGELRTLQRDMNRLFEGYAPSGAASRFPVLNVWSNGENAVVTAEVPGVDPKDLEINVVKGVLTIQGERQADAPGEGAVCHRAERAAGRFARTVRLPFEVENDRVSAKYTNGVLTVTLPRSEATKPKKVEIAAT